MDFQMLNLLLSCGKEFSHRRIRESGFSETECLICTYVLSHPGCSQDSAVQALRMDKTTLAKAVQGLETRGLLLRAQDTDDRRKKVLTLSTDGEHRIRAVTNLHDRWLKNVFSVLSPDEQTQFENLFLRLLRAAEETLPAQKKE